MKPFFVLYVKELKAHKILFLFVLLLIAGMNAYGIMQIAYVRHFKDVIESSDNLPLILWPNFSYFWPMLAVFTLVLSLPFLLAHAFNSEWKSETHYQMFALTIPQYKVILAKIAAVASVGFVGGGIVVCGLYLWMVTAAESVDGVFVNGVLELMSFPHFTLVTGLILVTYVVFIFGLVTGMEGVKFSVKRYRGLTAVIFFLGSVFLYGRLFQQGERAFEFLGQIAMPPFGVVNVAPCVYTILTGIIFMILGLVMYEKRAEI